MESELSRGFITEAWRSFITFSDLEHVVFPKLSGSKHGGSIDLTEKFICIWVSTYLKDKVIHNSYGHFCNCSTTSAHCRTEGNEEKERKKSLS